MIPFTLETVTIACKSIHSSTSTKEQKTEADKFLNDLLNSPEAWTITRELIMNSNPAEVDIVFMGANILYQKIKQDYSSLSKEHRQELDNFIYSTVEKVTETSNNKLVLSMVCRIYGMVGLFQLGLSQTPTFINSIYQQIEPNNLNNQSTKQIGLQLSIIEEIAGEYESLLLERKRMMFIISSLNDNKDNIQNFWCMLLESEMYGKDEAYLDKIFRSVNSWKDIKVQLLSSPRLIANLLKFQKIETFSEIITIILASILNTSNFSRIIESSNLEMARKRYKMMQPLIDNFMQTKVKLEELKDDSYFALEELYSNASVILIINEICGPNIKVDFENCMSQSKNWFSKSICEIVFELFNSWNIFMLINQPELNPLLQLGLLCLNHSDRAISYRTLEFWEAFKNDFVKNRNQADEATKKIFVELFVEVFKRLFAQTTIKNEEEVKSFEKPRNEETCAIDVDEDEDRFLECDRDKFVKVDLQTYRLIGEDVFYAVFHVLSEEIGHNNAIQTFMNLAQESINQNTIKFENPSLNETQLEHIYLLKVENTLYVLRALKDSIYEEHAKNKTINDMMNLVLNQSNNCNEVFFVRRSLQFLNDFSYELKGDFDLSMRFIDFIIKNFDKKVLLNWQCDILLRVIEEIMQPVPFDIFEKIAQFIKNNISQIKNEMALGNFISCLFKLSNYYESSTEITNALSHVLKVIEDIYLQYSSQKMNFRNDKETLKKLLLLIEATVRNQDARRNIEVHQTLMKQFQYRFYNEINQLFVDFHDIPGMYNPFCSFFRTVTSACPQEIYNYAPSMLDTMFAVMKKNPIKYADSLGICEGIIAFNIQSEFIVSWVKNNCQSLNIWLSQLLLENNDSSLISQFLLLQQSLFRISPSFYIDLESFDSTMEIILKQISSVNSMEVQKEGARFFQNLTSFAETFKSEKSLKLLPIIVRNIIQSFIDCPSQTIIWKGNVQSNLLVKNGELLNAGIRIETVHRWIVDAVQQLKIDNEKQNLTENEREILALALNKAKNDREVKKILHEFSYYIIGYETKDIFISMQLKYSQKSIQNVEVISL